MCSSDLAGGGGFNINLTDSPDHVVAGWQRKLEDSVDAHYFNSRYGVRNKALLKYLRKIGSAAIYNRQGRLAVALGRKIADSFRPARQGDRRSGKTVFEKFGARKIGRIDDYIKGVDQSVPTSEMSLKRINEKIGAEKC